MRHEKHGKSLLSQALTFRVPEGTTLSAIQSALSGLNCPRALAVWIIIRDDPSQLKSLTFDPLNYLSMEQCRDAYAATCLLSKSGFLKTGIDLKAVAFEKFQRMETHCKQTNRRFNRLDLDPSFRGPNVQMYNTFVRKISSVLVGYSPIELFDEANWGPGVTTLITGEMATATNKFQCETGITRDLYSLVAPLLTEGYPIWGAHLNQIGFPNFQVGNKVITVPKTAFTDRVIAVEPGLNLWFQKAIGLMIRKRLLVHGINLNSQDRNQQLAQIGSKTSRLACVDFSSASDTVSKELIKDAFPHHWWQLMDCSRSHFGVSESGPVKWEKFSSMGNGFTFELESLIFFAAAHAVCTYLDLDTSEISVYGDDVILPSGAYQLFSSFCEFLGFIVNTEKSHSGSNPFRESCGAHFYEGVDIKPIFIKKVARNILELYRQLNAVRRWSHSRVSSLACDRNLKGAWLTLFRKVPKKLRIFGPNGKGDGFIIGNFDEATPTRAEGGVEGYRVQQLEVHGVTRSSEEVGLFLDRLRNRSIQKQGNNFVLRGRTRISFNKKGILVSQWYDLGPWI